ncbi:MAG: inactive transglutaminase family protein [Woeseia sp.]|nr:inactive transglutaminase family protein [Woeseia sp.]MBT6211062.1 inactive transglutaminase family protein [Woeseia sp.]
MSPSAQTRKFSLFALVGLLLILGLGQSIHRHLVYDVPWVPGTEKLIWSIEASVQFFARGEPVTVNLRRPSDQDGFSVLDENGASPGYGLSLIGLADQPTAQWTVREANGQQTLYYRAEVLQRDSGGFESEPPPTIRSTSWEEPYATVVEAVLDQAVSLSADPFSLTRQLVSQFRTNDRGQNEQMLLDVVGDENLTDLLADMLQSRNIPAATVYGLLLEDGRRRQQLKPLLRVWSDNKSKVFPLGLESGEENLPLLLWQPTQGYVLEVTGGSRSDLRFSMILSENTNYGQVAGSLGDGSDLLGFSIHSLPIAEQAMFKTILLLPIGALVVCILRILVGLRTSGTFMPVLIALAFIETSLMTGLVGFLLVVAVGLMIRSYMSHLNLLLVARISAVIITVIAIIAVFSVFSHRVGLTEGLKITFFPMIILSWTVERMSILWEEEGWREVAIQGSGSLLTAVAAYLAMTSLWVRHLSFNFIGLQFVVLALIMMLGSYTGYRLLELRRFKPFIDQGH